MIYYETSNLQVQKKKKKLETLLTISLNGKWDLHKCDASSGLSDLFPISPRRSLGIYYFLMNLSFVRMKQNISVFPTEALSLVLW